MSYRKQGEILLFINRRYENENRKIKILEHTARSVVRFCFALFSPSLASDVVLIASGSVLSE